MFGKLWQRYGKLEPCLFPRAVHGWSLRGDLGVRFYADSGRGRNFQKKIFRTLWNALEKLQFKEIYQLKVTIYTLKIIEVPIYFHRYIS